ncbi:hypothetical protein EEL52_11600 [Muribaculaceae bacterium Isolate-113 (HZI)]|nr:hypothetical protein EEL53_11885 [Muribaculaceae bacterium Isolate-114 (HZI)]ROT19655.1 hypothetical protein EEL52_11600 [Muribaculaceae bacterium Isolate-113 (HZI)]
MPGLNSLTETDLIGDEIVLLLELLILYVVLTRRCVDKHKLVTIAENSLAYTLERVFNFKEPAKILFKTGFERFIISYTIQLPSTGWRTYFTYDTFLLCHYV